MFQEAEQFAIFLRRVEAMKAFLANNTTFVLTARDLTPLELLSPTGGVANRSAQAPAQQLVSPLAPVKE